MNYVALKAEIQSGPLAAALAPLASSNDTHGIANALNALSASFQVPRTIVPSHEILEALVAGDWANISAAEKQRVQTIISAGSVNLAGANTRAAFLAAFGVSTATRANLIALQTRAGSRAEFLGFGTVTALNVAQALRT